MRTPPSRWPRLALVGAAITLISRPMIAQTTQPAGSQPAEAPPASEQKPGPKDAGFFIPSKGISARSESEPPAYVKSVDQFGFPGTQDLTWLLFGAESRTRFELRDDEYRQNLDDGYRFLQRNRIYLGVKDILDPLRAVVEFQDSRQFGGDFAESALAVDQMDILQGYGELYLKDALGAGRPFRFQFGRMALSYVDNKLISRQKWNNTTNTFDGFRIQLGAERSDWQFDVFAAQPVEKRLRRRDRGDEQQWFYGLVGAWRRWSKFITIQPYYLILDQDMKTATDREIHTLGLYTYGPIGGSGFDYDTDLIFQWGNDGDLSQQAHAFSAELGYTFKVPWKPRLSALINYATGDHDPTDGVSNRFDRLFGTAHMFSMHDYFEFRNMMMPALRVMADPNEKIHLESMYRLHYLASDSDAWTLIGRRDPTHGSGHFVGQALEAFVTWKVLRQVDVEVGYACFLPGSFTRETGPADDSDFFYVQTTMKLDR